MSYHNWHLRPADVCGIYEVRDELSGRCYIGSSTMCNYRIALQMLGRDANVRRLPHRLHWLLWLLADIEQGTPLDG